MGVSIFFAIFAFIMKMEITILGSGASTPTSKRNLSAQVLHIRGVDMLIDCGEGTQMQFRKYKQKLQDLKYIFISHLHGDHFWGLPGLLSSMHMLGRQTPITIFSPKGLKNAISTWFSLSDTWLNFPVHYQELDSKQSEKILDEDSFEVHTLPLLHSVYCNGYIFKEKPKLKPIKKGITALYSIPHYAIEDIKKGADFTDKDGNILKNENLTLPAPKSYQYSYASDTAQFDELQALLKDTDVLYHEATFMHNLLERAISTKHSTALQVAELAQKLQVERLLLGHISCRYSKKEELLLAEAQSLFASAELVEDGKSYRIY